MQTCIKRTMSHTSCRCVDWNKCPFVIIIKGSCHTSCRCVDWNTPNWKAGVAPMVTPHVGVWIETALNNTRLPRSLVTPHVGVWIETNRRTSRHPAHGSHTSCRCVDWNITSAFRVVRNDRHTSCRCVDWNPALSLRINQAKGHTSCRCVDWNYFEQQEGEPLDVTPHVGVWIETWMTIVRLPRCSVTPHVGVWIETWIEFFTACTV